MKKPLGGGSVSFVTAMLFFIHVLIPGTASPQFADSEQTRGLLGVKVNIEGAAVSIDGKDAGVSPIREPLEMQKGKHTVKAAHPGYDDGEKEVEVNPGELTEVEITLELSALFGFISVSTDVPEALVEVDDTQAGKTPLETLGGVPTGEHTIRVSREGYMTWEGQVTIEPKKVTFVNVTLVRIEEVAVGEKKFYEKWWFWVAVGAAATGTAAGIAAASGSETIVKPNPDGTSEEGVGVRW
jgi:hypothetical protein